MENTAYHFYSFILDFFKDKEWGLEKDTKVYPRFLIEKKI
jgi:hypothetical protein